RDEGDLIDPQTPLYLRDCHDHAGQLLDMIETDREICSSLIDIHLSSLSIRLNEVMKVLTMIATIFIPLTFIAGVYGMNF
ncbi:CorA family divalent cation transporter, partial [Tritonibacter sp. SIMBA_163]|uniref:CorA family divalent cation transporter n=1 Tax=Tritonibacter sp. SIMBA_163 TaxID=3080868 RepID=UPI00397FB717